MAYLLITLSLFISIILSRLIIPRILVVAHRKKLFDIPDERKVHSGIIPRLGGVSFVPTILFSLAFVTGLRYIVGLEIAIDKLNFIIPEFYFMVCGLMLLYLSGIKDDLVGLRYRSKFIIQTIVACFIPLSGLWINNLYGLFGIHELTRWLGIPFTIFLTVFIVNAINLIDGIDGLASGLSSISLLALGSLYIYYEQWVYAMFAFSTLGVLLPFFYYNVFGQANRCKKIFMGDTGSLTIGLILAVLGTILFIHPDSAKISISTPILAFSPLIVPCFDVIRVYMLRIRQHHSPFLPDKNHIHHKILAAGMKPRAAMITIVSVSLMFTVINVTLSSLLSVNINIIIILDILLWGLSNIYLSRLIKKRNVTA